LPSTVLDKVPSAPPDQAIHPVTLAPFLTAASKTLPTSLLSSNHLIAFATASILLLLTLLAFLFFGALVVLAGALATPTSASNHSTTSSLLLSESPFRGQTSLI